MTVGWKKINNDWYYFNSNGEMQTGWQNTGTQNIILEIMVYGHWIRNNGRWHYFNENEK